MVWDRYPEEANMICFSMFDIVNLLLKKNKRLILFSWFALPLIAGLALAPLMFFKDKTTLNCSPEMKCQQDFTTEIGYILGI